MAPLALSSSPSLGAELSTTTTTSTPNLTLTLGVLLLGSWTNCLLHALSLQQLYTYFRSSNNDSRWLKATIVGLAVNDLVSTVGGAFSTVWWYCVSHWGEESVLEKQVWGIAVFGITTGISALVVQFFLLSRLYALLKKWLLLIPLTLAILASFAGCLWAVTGIITHPLYAERERIRVPVTLWLTISFGCDITIALLLLYKLNKARAAAKGFSQSTMHIPLKRLMILVVESGTATSMLAGAGYLSFLAWEKTNVPTALGFNLGRVYTLTLLFNLNIRTSLRSTIQQPSHLPRLSSKPEGLRSQHLSVAGGISVSRIESIVTDVGDYEEFESRTRELRRGQLCRAPPRVRPIEGDEGDEEKI